MISTSFTDEELAKKSIENIDFFAELFTRYEKKLFFYIRRISYFSEEEAEEILQDSFIKAWKNLKGFDKDLSFSTWIYRIVHNTTISEWKKTQSKNRDSYVKIEESEYVNIPSNINIIKELEIKCTKQEVQKLLYQLSPQYKEVLILKFIEEKSYEEISDILQKPSGTIATLISRAKKQFKQISEKQNISF
jgi:RNA polymerase sigma-70 factor (ECF subfamily)